MITAWPYTETVRVPNTSRCYSIDSVFLKTVTSTVHTAFDSVTTVYTCTLIIHTLSLGGCRYTKHPNTSHEPSISVLPVQMNPSLIITRTLQVF